MNQNQKQKQQEEDRLTNLPNGLLIEILNLLPIKTAASTTVLSQRWRNLWTQITSITINDRHLQNSSSNFHSIADAIISQLTSPLIRSFTLWIDNPVALPSSSTVDSWLTKICSRNIEVIKVDVDYSDNIRIGFNLPACVLQTKSLVKLRFWNSFEGQFPDVEINLPNLKFLELFVFPCDCWIVAKLTRACPLLESLDLMSMVHHGEGDVIVDICSTSLKSLFISFESTDSSKFVIDAPNLVDIRFCAEGGSVCSLVTKPTALRSAKLQVSTQPLVRSLIKLVSSVVNLEVGYKTFLFLLKSLKAEEDNAGKPLVFNNLETLSLEILSACVYVDPPSWIPLDAMPKGLLTNVKAIAITICILDKVSYWLTVTKCLLISAPVLKTFCIVFLFGGSKAWRRDEALRVVAFCNEVLKYPRSSSQCQIKFCRRVKVRIFDVIPEELLAETMEINSAS